MIKQIVLLCRLSAAGRALATACPGTRQGCMLKRFWSIFVYFWCRLL